MRSLLCHLVPACALALALAPASGCFLDHGRDTRSMPGDPDAGSARPDPDAGTAPRPRADAGRPTPIDAGAAPTECPPVRADATCLESFTVRPSLRFELPVTFDTCACCAESECLVDVDHAERRLLLTTALCPDPCDCDACYLPEARCAVPGLATGIWRVEVNGSEAFELPVQEEITESPLPPACATYAQPDTCSVNEPLRGPLVHPDELCVEHGPFEDVRVELAFDCPRCPASFGPCQVILEPRYTDDLPPGGELHVRPTQYDDGCSGACPPGCFPTTRECLVPPLVSGHFYRVWVDGAPVTGFTAGEVARSCIRP